ncbi:MAG: hypothetical protein BWY59_00995 [Verrucomicrobia bacterium ADurb.Bin345]|nr:MAG: hypothetical protein BWY59_00995 [Verrucomicrobia bacterium ADurb.Bin345]
MPLNRPGPQAKDQPQQPRFRSDGRIPGIRIERNPDAGKLREKQLPELGARNALHQQRHLLVTIEHAPLRPVGKRILAHRAGVNPPHRPQKRFQALLMSTAVDAENTLVLSRKRIAEVILQQAAGPHDDRILPEVIEHVRKAPDDVVGESPFKDALPAFLRAIQHGVLVLLLLPDRPASVLHKKGIEDVRPNIERVVRFQQIFPSRVGSPQDGSRKEHADRLAADQARTDGPLPCVDQVRKREVLPRQRKNAFIAGDDLLQLAAKDTVHRFLRAVTPGVRLKDLLRGDKAPVPHPDHPVGRRLQTVPGARSDDARDHRAFHNRTELIALPDMQHVHGGRISLGHLEGVEIGFPSVAVDIQHELRRGFNRQGRVMRMVMPQDREVAERTQPKEIRTGEHKEVADHSLAETVERQVGKRIKQVIGVAAHFPDDLVNAGDELLESVLRMQPAHTDLRVIRHELPMPAEAEIHKLLSHSPRVIAEGFDERKVIIHGFDLPYDIVARPNPMQDVVQAWQACAELRVVLFPSHGFHKRRVAPARNRRKRVERIRPSARSCARAAVGLCLPEKRQGVAHELQTFHAQQHPS